MPELNPDSIGRTIIDARTIDPKKNTAVLAIHERLVARLLADDLVRALGARVGEIRRQVKARIWDNGLVTRY
jgi:hypothetical protein